MHQKLRTYQLAVGFHRACRQIEMPNYLRDQIARAASSIALNLAEGSGRSTDRDQLRFYQMALGSLREAQAALDLALVLYPDLVKQAAFYFSDRERQACRDKRQACLPC